MQQTWPPLKPYDHIGGTYQSKPSYRTTFESIGLGLETQLPLPLPLPFDQTRISPQLTTPDEIIPGHPYPTPPMNGNGQYMQLPAPQSQSQGLGQGQAQQMNPPSYYPPAPHRQDQRLDLQPQGQSQHRHTVHPQPQPHQSPYQMPDNGQVQGQASRYLSPPHAHSYNSDGSPVGYPSYNSQVPYNQYQPSPYSPYQSLAPPPHQIAPGSAPASWNASPLTRPMHASTSTSAHSIKTPSPKKRKTPLKAKQGKEGWKWDVSNEDYAAMTTEQRKQVRNRCGARAFRAKRKAEDSARATQTEHLKQQMLLLHHQLNNCKARLGEPPVDLPSFEPPEGFEVPPESLGLGLDFQGGESDNSLDFA